VLPATGRAGSVGDIIMDNLKTYLAPLGRLLMSSLFIWAGVGKLRNPGGTAQYFANVHIPVPDVTVWIVIIIELAIFCLITAFGVHLPVGDTPNMVNFYKNLVMAGGFLYIVAYGPGGLSIDGDKA
jgi:putative oxidoreductase